MSIKEKISIIIGKLAVKGSPMTTLIFTDPKITLLPNDTFTISGPGVMHLFDKDGKQTAKSIVESMESTYTNDDGVVTSLTMILDNMGVSKENIQVHLLTLQMQYGKTESMEIEFTGGEKASVVLQRPLSVR